MLQSERDGVLATPPPARQPARGTSARKLDLQGWHHWSTRIMLWSIQNLCRTAVIIELTYFLHGGTSSVQQSTNFLLIHIRYILVGALNNLNNSIPTNVRTGEQNDSVGSNKRQAWPGVTYCGYVCRLATPEQQVAALAGAPRGPMSAPGAAPRVTELSREMREPFPLLRHSS